MHALQIFEASLQAARMQKIETRLRILRCMEVLSKGRIFAYMAIRRGDR
jgi:hypothetical protein